MDGFDDYSTLLEIINDAWNGQYVYKDFQHELNAHIGRLANPREKKCNADSKRAVESKEVVINSEAIKIEDELLSLILEVSRALDLDEIETTQLFYTARRRRLREYATMPPELRRDQLLRDVFELHFTKRLNLLISILDLVMVYTTPADFSEDLVCLAQDYIKRLLDLGLVTHLTALVAELQTRSEAAIQPQHDQEMWHAAQILFYLFLRYHEDMKASHTKALIDCTRALSNLLTPASRPHLRLVAYTLLVSLQASLHVQAQVVVEGGVQHRHNVDEQELAAVHAGVMQELAEGQWTNPAFRALFQVCWGLFLARLAQRLDFARAAQHVQLVQEGLRSEHGALVALQEGFLGTAHLQQDTRAENVAEAIGEFLNILIIGHLDQLKAMRARDQQLLAPEQVEKSNTCGLLRLVTTVCQVAPHFGRWFAANPEFVAFMAHFLQQHDGTVPAMGLDSPLLGAYVAMLEGLCSSDGSSCHVVYTLLDQDLVKLRWPDLLGLLKYVNQQYRPQPPQSGWHMGRRVQQTPPPPQQLTAQHAHMVQCCLRLVRAVARSQLTRLKVMEAHQPYVEAGSRSPPGSLLDSLFGLLGCRLGPPLKAEVLLAITAFAQRCPNGDNKAAEIWEMLERWQVLPTRPDHASLAAPLQGAPRGHGQAATAQPSYGDRPAAGFRGLAHDLEEVEASAETYPLTIAFLTLLLSLLKAAAVPFQLGAGKRAGAPPGIGPYLDFVKYRVFDQLYGRKYSNVAERWQLAELCLAIFTHAVELFQTDPQAGIPAGSTQAIHLNSPGGRVMQWLVDLQNRFLPSLLRLVEESNALLEAQPSPSASPSTSAAAVAAPGQESSGLACRPHAEGCLLLALRLLACGLRIEQPFIKHLRDSHKYAKAAHLSDVLLDLKQAAVVVFIGRNVGCIQNSMHTAVQLLVRCPLAGPDLASEGDLDPTEISYHATTILSSLSRRDPVKLKQTLERGAPHDLVACFAHQLDYTYSPPAPAEEGGEAGGGAIGGGGDHGANHNRARLAIVELLRLNLAAPTPNLTQLILGYDASSSDEVELSVLAESRRGRCLEVLVKKLVRKPLFACNNPVLAEACFHLFHALAQDASTSAPFFVYLQHLEGFFLDLLDRLPPLVSPCAPGAGPRVCSVLFQRSWLLKTIALELHLAWQRRTRGESWLDVVALALSRLGLRRASGQQEGDGYYYEEQRRLVVLELLETLQLEVPEDPPELPESIGGVQTALCRMHNAPRSFEYNLPNLEALCNRAVGMAGREGSAAQGQRERAKALALKAEHLANARAWNANNALLLALDAALEGWKRVVETCLSECMVQEEGGGVDDDDDDDDESALFQLLSALLEKLNSGRRVWTCLGEKVSATALTVLASMRELSLSLQGEQEWQCVLPSTIKAILHTPPDHTMTRAHLYAVFLNYVQYTGAQGQMPAAMRLMGDASFPARRQLERQHQDQRVQQQQQHEQLLIFARNHKLLEVACADAEDGNRRLRSMALVFITSLQASFPDPVWLAKLQGLGAISKLLKDLQTSDRLLCAAVVSARLQHYEHILCFEALAGLLTTLAASTDGADCLQNHQVVEQLQACSFISQRPSALLATASSCRFPSPTQRHHQLLLPTLALLVALLTAGPLTRRLLQSVLGFVVAHSDVLYSFFDINLQQPPPELSSSLQLTTLTTLLLSFLFQGVRKGLLPSEHVYASRPRVLRLLSIVSSLASRAPPGPGLGGGGGRGRGAGGRMTDDDLSLLSRERLQSGLGRAARAGRPDGSGAPGLSGLQAGLGGHPEGLFDEATRGHLNAILRNLLAICVDMWETDHLPLFSLDRSGHLGHGAADLQQQVYSSEQDHPVGMLVTALRSSNDLLRSEAARVHLLCKRAQQPPTAAPPSASTALVTGTQTASPVTTAVANIQRALASLELSLHLLCEHISYHLQRLPAAARAVFVSSCHVLKDLLSKIHDERSEQAPSSQGGALSLWALPKAVGREDEEDAQASLDRTSFAVFSRYAKRLGRPAPYAADRFAFVAFLIRRALAVLDAAEPGEAPLA